MDLVEMKTPTFVEGKSLTPMLKNINRSVRQSALSELQVNTKSGIAQGYSIKTNRYRLSRWKHQGVYSYELYDHETDKKELNNLINHIDYIQVKDSLIKILSDRIIAAQKKPKGLGRQIKYAKPWQEPKRIHSTQKNTNFMRIILTNTYNS